MRRVLGLVLAGSALVACLNTNPRAPQTHDALAPSQLLPARLRRLSNAEYERAAGELLGEPVSVQGQLPPDIRQEGFTLNADQPVPAAHATRLSTLAQELAKRAARERLAALAPCAGSGSRSCAERFVREYGRKAFRRPLTTSERRALEQLFEEGRRDGRGFSGGVELVLQALLQAPSFLYVSELGEPAPAGKRQLSSLEMASSLAFLVRGGPPDEALLRAGERGLLSDPEERVRQARRLLGQSDTRHHFRRFVLEWLEVDELADTAKDNELAPSFERLKGPMLDETRAFVDEVMVHEGASLRSLLTAGFTSVQPSMARHYELSAYGPRVSLERSPRLGILQHASFLAAHAHEDSTSPVKRGDFVMRKLLCTTLPRPQELNIEVTIPAPDPTLTTRERFAAHVTNSSCQACHAPIDALGYTFENFDTVGRARASQNGKSIDTRASFEHAGISASFDDSVELSRFLAESPVSHDCFARHAFRYFSAQTSTDAERAFLDIVHRLAPSERENLVEMLVAYVKSELFSMRREPELEAPPP